MYSGSQGLGTRMMRWGAAAAAGLLSLGLLNTAALASPPNPGTGQPGSPLVQQFQDVPDSNPFSAFVNNLYVDGIISGYACGGAGEPCVPPANLPYYRPGASVTRAQMAKFVDNGRRNISDAVGISLQLLNSPAYNPIWSQTTTNQEAIVGECLTASNCYGIQVHATNVGNYGGVFNGSYQGVYASQTEANGAAVFATAGDGIGVYGSSTGFRGVQAYTASAGTWSLWVDAAGGNTATGSTLINGALVLNNGCTGCLASNIIQNVDGSALEVGDVVSIVGTSAPVLGQQPVVTVKKATVAYDGAVIGVVNGAIDVPSAQTASTFAAQKAAYDAAVAQRAAAMKADDKAAAAAVVIPALTISDKDATVHPAGNTTSIAANGYADMLTTGAAPAVKVDASFGAIQAGDVLVASPHAGYAMKASDKAAAAGATLGKALGTLESGTGTIAVMITLK